MLASTTRANKPKISVAKACHGVNVPAMRQNPTAATGPVSIKHVRNTVPKALPAAQQAVINGRTFITIGSTCGKSIPKDLQLEEPSL